MASLAAQAYGLVILGVIGFQVGLVVGMPWGHLTQGGRHEGALPQSGRVAAAVSVLLLAGMAAAVTSAAGLAPGWPAWTGWVAVGVQGLSMLANWATPSVPERRLWGPVTTGLFLLAAFVVCVG